MTEPLAALSSAPVLARVERSGFVESVHHGMAVEVAADGSVTRAYGEVDAPTFPRSSNKPMQAVAMLRAGLDLDGELLALVCASHSGEDFHLEGVRRILASAGLAEGDLQNTPDYPYDDQARLAWLQAARPKAAIAQNCSGKHAGMLATCAAAGWDLATYRDPDHPLQQLMAETLGELAGEPVAATGIDGCGAPVMAISLAGVARAFGRLAAAADGTGEGRVRDAIRAFPEFLGGSRRDVTELIRGVDGLIAKDGAEAVYGVGLADGRGFAVKIVDGAQRARTPVMAALLRGTGVDESVLDEIGYVPVLGHGATVGTVVAQGI
ncbi:asparaginase [Luteipulveratus mongoliensis]|uniref:Asparaginase n=1 Tax=Luteipulveratus mongoliensis TaxID=571913 RepID=A0A0K1JQ64_9MICO|nr:asparaginase [Luteipulveratus mongoliensis]AKU18723.1 asparaginase [Luteipulveratus mongoliensis]